MHIYTHIYINIYIYIYIASDFLKLRYRKYIKFYVVFMSMNSTTFTEISRGGFDNLHVNL